MKPTHSTLRHELASCAGTMRQKTAKRRLRDLGRCRQSHWQASGPCTNPHALCGFAQAVGEAALQNSAEARAIRAHTSIGHIICISQKAVGSAQARTRAAGTRYGRV